MIRTVSLTSGPNASATITIIGQQDSRHCLYGILWSYSADPSGGRITTQGLWSGDDLDLDVVVGGPGEFSFPPVVAEEAQNFSVTIAAGGSGITGKLAVLYSTE
jgi:hypothetical protein